MGVRVSGRGLSGAQRRVLEEVRAIAPTALRLVESHLGRSAGRVEVVVVDPSRIHDLLVAVHQDLLGTRNLPTYRLDEGACLGRATWSSSGALVVLDAERLSRKPHEVAATVVHEFAHCVQFARPGARERGIRYLRNNYDVAEMARWKAHWANQRVARDEREAEGAEFLAAHLTKAVA